MGRQDPEEHQKTPVHDPRRPADRHRPTSVPHQDHQRVHDNPADGSAWRVQRHHRQRSDDVRTGKGRQRAT